MALILYHTIALWLGFALDKLLGDPQWLPHPIVAFGKTISFLEKKLNKNTHRLLKGYAVTILLVFFTCGLFFTLITFAFQISPLAGIATETIFVFYGLAGTTLVREGKAVFRALDKGLEEGRRQVARIVGRDTEALTKNEIQAATLETLAENLSDGVIAPLFWYAIAGIPGMMTYKMVNTLDSMIGYKNDRFIHFGRFAARLDDAANYLPARITALLMAAISGKKRAFKFIRKYGRAHLSPNAGYPEAALAGILNVVFGSAHRYFGQWVPKPLIGENKRDFEKNDLHQTINIIKKTEWIFIILISLIFIVLTYYK
ncbi:adenosylcobinamide-phosphate synthase CbiB [Geofilum sp. OHC36d9]|uniref:adenosylcobinamide-phosphate synthase CbiB n=1 Tax=Geofilum sp. OHC36d9 TaxID=3458413 RepID=UPI004034035A